MQTIKNGDTMPVSHKDFFAALYADSRDIMPRIVGPWNEQAGYTHEWTVVATRAMVGISTSGILGKNTYFLATQPAALAA